MNDELLTVKKKKLDKEVLMKKLNNNADKFIEQAALVIKAQSFKKFTKGKEKVIADMNKMMEKIGK